MRETLIRYLVSTKLNIKMMDKNWGLETMQTGERRDVTHFLSKLRLCCVFVCLCIC